jgi:hemerythrin-like domain-containing protein
MKLEDPIRLLREEHDRVLEVADSMEMAVADLQGPRRREAWTRLNDGLAFLETAIRGHQGIEETTLYPALARHAPQETIDVMLEEHADIGWAMDRLAKDLTKEASYRSELRWHATALVDLLRRHIDKENNVLFMMVSQMLPDSEYDELARAIHALLHAEQRPA